MIVSSARPASSQHTAHEADRGTSSSDTGGPSIDPNIDPDKRLAEEAKSEPVAPWRGLNPDFLHDAAKLVAGTEFAPGVDLTGHAKDPRVDDLQDRSLSWIGNRMLSPDIAAALNLNDQLAGQGHGDARSQLVKQFNDTLNQLGLGGPNGTPGTGTPHEQGAGARQGTQDGSKVFPGSPRDISQYASGDGGVNVADIIKFTVPPPPADSKGGATPKDSRIQWIEDAAKKVEDVAKTPIGVPGAIETTPGQLIGGAAAGGAAGVSGPPKGDTPAGSPSSSPPPQNAGEKAAAEAKAKAQQEEAKKEEEEKAKQEALKKEAQKAQEKAKEGGKTPDKKNVDPDQAAQPVMPASEDIAMRLNGRKRPIDPATGNGSAQIDGAKPPRKVEGVDPTVAYVDNLLSGGNATGPGTRVTTAPIDYAQGRAPAIQGGNPKPAGDGTADR